MMEQFLVWTESGLTSISSAKASVNTYHKRVWHLWALLNRANACHLVRFVMRLTPARYVHLREVVEALTDGELVVLGAMLNAALPDQLSLYLEILSDTFSYDETFQKDLVEFPSSERYVPEDFDTLQRNVSDTPGEIRELIMDHYLEGAIAPGYLFPNQAANDRQIHHLHGRKYPKAEYHALMALSRRLLREYQPRYWMDNTWVIGPGEGPDTLGFLNRMEEINILSRIKSVHLSFTTNDVRGAADLRRNITSAMQQQSGRVDNLKLLECFGHISREKSEQLLSTWWHKFSVICYLDLDDLTLDLTEAYSPDKVFLPNTDWIQTLAWFKHGTPQHFTIKVPASELLGDIQAAFIAIQEVK